MAIGVCARCGGNGEGRTWVCAYGLAPRGASPRTGRVDERVLGTEAVFLCARGTRWLVLLELLRSLASDPRALFFLALAGAGAVQLDRQRFREMAVAALIGAALGLALFVHRFRKRGLGLAVERRFQRRRRALAEAHRVKRRELRIFEIERAAE
jgi:hypothetical protein